MRALRERVGATAEGMAAAFEAGHLGLPVDPAPGDHRRGTRSPSSTTRSASNPGDSGAAAVLGALQPGRVRVKEVERFVEGHAAFRGGVQAGERVDSSTGASEPPARRTPASSSCR